jgi:hypothetical protein
MSSITFPLFNSVFNENNILNNTMKQIHESNSTYDQNVYYENERIGWLKNISSFLFFTYFILFSIIILQTIIKKNKMNFKICLLYLLLFSYPFYVNHIQNFIYNMMIYIYTFIQNKSYAI